MICYGSKLRHILAASLFMCLTAVQAVAQGINVVSPVVSFLFYDDLADSQNGMVNVSSPVVSYTYYDDLSGTLDLQFVASQAVSYLYSATSSLSVIPDSANVSSTAGVASFSVQNLTATTLTWTPVVLSSPWLAITSGVQGGTLSPGQSDTISVSYSANSALTQRIGLIRISAPGATPDHVDVTVTQDGIDLTSGQPHLSFSTIPSPQSINTPSSVTITARTSINAVDTTFNGRVDVFVAPETSTAHVTPVFVNLVNGTWSGNLTLDMPSPSTVLRATAGSRFGQSNPFDVTSLSVGPSRIKGVVYFGIIGAPVDSGFAVHLRSASDPAFSATDLTDQYGRYSFDNLVPGQYSVNAESGSLSSLTQDDFFVVPPSKTIVRDLFVKSTRIPVLLVPGIAGSTSRSHEYDLYPDLPPSVAARSDLVLYDPFQTDTYRSDFSVWNNLKNTLLNNGYEVFDVPWDWRVPFEEAWRLYLLPRIDAAKAWSQTDKVYVVAHSMGGLMLRSYIQSPEYRDDIAALAMVGTPNDGALMSYYFWEGADPVLADRMARASFWDNLTELASVPNFYAHVAGNLWEEQFGTPLYFYPPLGADPRLQVSRRTLYDFIHARVPTLGELMPSFPFLLRNGQLDQTSGSLNSVLDNLNSDPSVYRLISPGVPPSANTVITKVFASKTDGQTLQSIAVGEAGSPPFYAHGVPVSTEPDITYGSVVFGGGDGTVLRSSARANLWQVAMDDTLTKAHALLMNGGNLQIVGFLNQVRGGKSDVRIPAVKEAPGQTAYLVLTFSGRIEPMIMDPLNRQVGISPTDGQLIQDIPDSRIGVDSDGANIRIENPMLGTYTISLSGITGDGFKASTTYGTSTGVSNEAVRGIIAEANAVFFVTIQDGVSPSLLVDTGVSPANQLSSASLGGLASLTWSTQGAKAITGYDVYGRKDSDATWSLLGQTSATTFSTGHAWNGDGAHDTWYYAVIAIDGTGNRSFYTQIARNSSPVIASFDVSPSSGDVPLTVGFTDSSTGGVTTWAWDFESDGVVDSTIQNPGHEYTSAGIYTVTLTVTGPEGTDTSVNVGCVHAGYVSGSFLVQSAPEDNDTAFGTNSAQTGEPDNALLDFGGNGDVYYDLFRYDVTTAPSAAQTLKAEFQVYVESLGAQDPALQVYRITQDWTEGGVTLAANPDSVFYQGFGPLSQGRNTVDITDLYKAWKTGVYPNYGFKLVPTNTTNAHGMFASSDNADPTKRPRLLISIVDSIYVSSQVATPDITPASGPYLSPLDVTITCATSGATLRYTDNGNSPTEQSPIIASGTVLHLPLPVTIRAKAWKNGMTPSDTATRHYEQIDTLTVTTPNGGEKWRIGKKKKIIWTSSGAVGDKVKIELLQNGNFVQDIKGSTRNDGKQKWKLPNTLTPGKGYKVQITDKSNAAITDSSNRSFRIKAAK